MICQSRLKSTGVEKIKKPNIIKVPWQEVVMGKKLALAQEILRNLIYRGQMTKNGSDGC